MSAAKILIVEDQEMVALNLARRLQRQGYLVVGSAVSGEEAIRLATETWPDLVLMDIQLPGSIDGIEAANQIRMQLDRPVVFLTALANDETIQRARITAPYGYLLKPFEEKELRAAIEMALFRHQMEQKLKENEQRYRRLAELSPDAILVEQKGEIVFANPAAYQLLAVTDPAMLVGKSFVEFVHPLHRERARLLTRQEESVSEFSKFSEQKIIRLDGQWVDTEVGYVPITYHQSQAVQIVVRDITQRKRTEQNRYQARKLESLTALAGGVAHDFNNLLVALLGQIGLAAAKLPADSEPVTHLSKATEVAERASELAQQLLLYSGRGTFETRLIDLNALILENIRLFSAVIPTHVDIRSQLGTARPVIEGNVAQLREVIVNLLLNAAQAIGQQPGVVTIGTNTVEVQPNDDHLWRITGNPLPPGRYHTIEVHDSGPGLDEETKSRLFDPFFAVASAENRLGLATVLGIVRSHQGGLEICNGSGAGTAFKLLFPVNPVTMSQGVSEVTWNPIQHAAGTLLVIDDEPAVREAVVDILETESIQVLTAENGREGVEKYQANLTNIDLVLLDLSMPEMNGDETYRQLRQINPKVRVVLSSGYDRLNVMERFDSSGLQGFLQKPYDMATLIDVVKKHMSEAVP